jgi:hypothetical protein
MRRLFVRPKLASSSATHRTRIQQAVVRHGLTLARLQNGPCFQFNWYHHQSSGAKYAMTISTKSPIRPLWFLSVVLWWHEKLHRNKKRIDDCVRQNPKCTSTGPERDRNGTKSVVDPPVGPKTDVDYDTSSPID